jgi:hypothetical protein
MKERVLEEISAAGVHERFITARELVRMLGVTAADPLRVVKRRIEELKDEGHPIVGLPEAPGPGFTYVHDPETPFGREVVERFNADMGSRFRKMARHVAVVKRLTDVEARRQLALEV